MSYTAFANQEYRNVFQTSFEIPALLRAMRIARGRRILEVGCGRGVALPRFAELCAPSRLVGVDIDARSIEQARERMSRAGVRVELHVGDVRTLPFADGAFDVVIDFGTCYHIDHAERALREIGRVLESGGLFVYETTLAQRMAHPIRASGQSLPWDASSELVPERHALLWASRKKR